MIDREGGVENQSDSSESSMAKMDLEYGNKLGLRKRTATNACNVIEHLVQRKD